MKMNPLLWIALMLSLVSCKKDITGRSSEIDNTVAGKEFVKYTILKGQHNCDKNVFLPVQYMEQKFVVKFDSSAIYQTELSGNQVDVNKLYGFSDNNTIHQQFSARFGWRWRNNELQVFAYVYNNGERIMKQLGTAPIGAENACSIKVSGSSYIFSLNGKTETMPRASGTPNSIGYKLYPYFGGDEPAPHNINIWIKEL